MSHIKYFGTDLDRSGHFIWDVSSDGRSLRNRNLNFNSLDFDPERLTDPYTKKHYLTKGTVMFFTTDRCTICFIEGSCIDDRQGTKSVFWVECHVSFPELKDMILRLPFAQEMFAKMNFKINWTL